MNIKEYIKQWAESYKTDLTENIMPFWMEHGWDKVNGGVYTCLDRDGSLIDSTKSVWFQGRFAFICAYAYNNVEKNPMWLEAAKSTIDFIEKHCFDENGRMYFSVTAEGKPLRMRRYVFSETFAAIAMPPYCLSHPQSQDQSKICSAISVISLSQPLCLATSSINQEVSMQ
jgi:N-acylglucosamine 2-epimerase